MKTLLPAYGEDASDVVLQSRMLPAETLELFNDF